MAVQHPRVRVVEDRGLHRPAEQRLGLAHEVLVERVFARDENREAGTAATCPAPLLPQRRHGAREADRDRAVEAADVDSELERVGGGDAEQLAGHQALLDLAPLRRRVAGAVRGEPGSGLRLDAFGGEAVDELDGLTALGEADRAQVALDEGRQQARGVAERACADTELRVDQLRVPERDRPLGPWGRVAVDHRRRLAEQRFGQLGCVRDRRRGQNELGLGVVCAGKPAEPPEHVGDVRPEHSAVDVRLVDDHVAEVREHVAPAVVMRQDAHVEHVRVRQDHVRPLPDLPAPLSLGVPVVDRRLDPLHAELAERARLVLSECLRRVEVQRSALRLAGEQVENGQVEGKALPARGARRHDRVAAGTQGFPGLGLMRVEPGDPLGDESRGDAGVEVVRELLGAPGFRRLDREVRELCSLEELEPGRRDDTHNPYASLRPTGVPIGLRTHPSNLIRLGPAKGVE